MERTVECEFELTEKQILSLNFAHMYKNFGLIILTISGAVDIFYMIADAAAKGTGAFPDFNIAQWLLAAFTVFIPLATYLGAKRTLKSRFMTEKRKYAFDEQGFQFETQSHPGEIRWSDIQRTGGTKKLIFLYFNARAVHLIPVESLASAADLTQLKEWISRHAKKSGKLKASI